MLTCNEHQEQKNSVLTIKLFSNIENKATFHIRFSIIFAKSKFSGTEKQLSVLLFSVEF